MLENLWLNLTYVYKNQKINIKYTVIKFNRLDKKMSCVFGETSKLFKKFGMSGLSLF